MAVKEIVKDLEVLKTVSKPTTYKDAQDVIRDLIDTAEANKDRCVGLSAIQIGVPLRVCVVFDGKRYVPFVNPTITKTYGRKYTAEEGCMSLDGTKEVERYEGIHVFYRIKNGVAKDFFRGYFAEVLQHEIDHFDGKLI